MGKMGRWDGEMGWGRWNRGDGMGRWNRGDGMGVMEWVRGSLKNRTITTYSGLLAHAHPIVFTPSPLTLN